MTDDNKRLDQSTFRVDWIACKYLSVVWVQAQRKYREERAREIAANFDPELFNPIRVTLPNGNGIYHICDGQHGKGAVEMLWGPEEKVPCLVAPEGDPVRAADLFLRNNSCQRPPSKIDHFKVSVTAKRPNEVAINRIVRKHGYRVDSSGKKIISAVSALKFVYNCGPKPLDQTLYFLDAVWTDDHHAMGGGLLRGFGVFLNEFGDYIDPKRFIQGTKKWTPGTLIRDAKAMLHTHGLKLTPAIAQLLLEQYNHGLRHEKHLKHKPGKDTKDPE
jgi:hypothetical protein